MTVKYYENIGHMEPVFAIGAMWRWRAPVLADMVAFFTQFGAFPSGAPRPAYTPERRRMARPTSQSTITQARFDPVADRRFEAPQRVTPRVDAPALRS